MRQRSVSALVDRAKLGFLLIAFAGGSVGTWGDGAFENDDALDFLKELRSNGIDAIRHAIDIVVSMNQGDYLDAPECAFAIAAAEVVAAMVGEADPRLPDDVGGWLLQAPAVDDKLRAAALAAVGRISTNSELAQLWIESGDKRWLARQANLRDRLSDH